MMPQAASPAQPALLVDASREIGATPVLLTEANLLSSDTAPEDLQRIQYEYQSLTPTALLRAVQGCADAVREVAREKKVDLWDTAAVLGHRGEYFDDHVHLSRSGAQAISSAVAASLARALGQAAKAPSAGDSQRPAPLATGTMQISSREAPGWPHRRSEP